MVGLSKEYEQVEGFQPEAGQPAPPTAPANAVPTGAHLPLGTKLAYGVGGMAFGIKDNGLGFFLLTFYAYVLGLNPGLVSLALSIALIVDAIYDPVIGYVSDHTRSPLKRRHPYMYAAALPMALGFFFLWNAPAGLSETGLFFYLLFMVIAVRMMFATFEIPNIALVPELTTDYVQRTSLMGIRYFFGYLGGVGMAQISYFALFQSTPEYPNGMLNPDSYHLYGWVAAGLMLTMALICCVGTHSRIKTLTPAASVPSKLGPAINAVSKTLASRNLAAIFASSVFLFAGSGISATLTIITGIAIWGMNQFDLGIASIGWIIGAALAWTIAPRFVRRFEKKSVAVGIGILVAFLNPLLPVLKVLGLMPPNEEVLFILPGFDYEVRTVVFLIFLMAIVDICLTAAMNMVISAMVADAVEEAQLRTGVRAEGVLFAVRTLIAKITGAAGTLIAGVILALVGIEREQAQNADPEKIATLIWSYTPVIFVLGMGAALALQVYRIDRKTHEANLARLRGEDRLAKPV